jgi:hypothetical protein
MKLEEVEKRWPPNVFYPPRIDEYDVEDIRKASNDIQWLINRVKELEADLSRCREMYRRDCG